jgi:hypothetical protein
LILRFLAAVTRKCFIFFGITLCSLVKVSCHFKGFMDLLGLVFDIDEGHIVFLQ